MALKRQHNTLSMFSMASMTDVIFLLLIFFLVTSTFVFPSALEVNLPQSSEQTSLAYLDINNVVKRYEEHTALDGVSMQVEQGVIYGLLGPNGAGKSTLIRIINRILAADKGTVTLNGKQMTDDDIAHIGYLPEERGLYKKMKVGDHIVYDLQQQI